jgi:hypothetical protein
MRINITWKKKIDRAADDKPDGYGPPNRPEIHQEFPAKRNKPVPNERKRKRRQKTERNQHGLSIQ